MPIGFEVEILTLECQGNTPAKRSIILYCSDYGLQFKPTKVTVDLKTSQEGIKHRYMCWHLNYRM